MALRLSTCLTATSGVAAKACGSAARVFYRAKCARKKYLTSWTCGSYDRAKQGASVLGAGEKLGDPKVWNAFARRYRSEMKATDARQTIEALAQLARRTPISVGCFCHGPHCHRFELERLIRRSAAGEA
jgi:hypothetical protein